MRKIVSILLCCLLIFSVVGCNEKTNTDKKEDVKINKLDKFKNTLKEKGYTVGENETLAFQMVGATNGYKFKVDGNLIEIYEYDEKNLSEEGKKFIEQAKNGSINLSGFNVPVKYNNYLMLSRVNEHPKGKEIVEIFNGI